MMATTNEELKELIVEMMGQMTTLIELVTGEDKLERIAVALEKIAESGYTPPTNGNGTNGDDPGTEPPDEEPEFDAVIVTVDKAPLREVTHLNKNGVGVLGIYGKSDTSARIVAKKGKVLDVFGDAGKFDGGHLAYKLPSSQVVDGKWLPGDQYLYVLARHVE